jgi:chromosome segregation ATPase
LSSLATRFKSLSLAKLAAEVSSGGHFDKVIAAIDKMMEVLRAEEQDDIKHRDRCQRSENKNGNEMEDLNSAIEKKGASIDRMKDEAGATKEKIAELEAQMKATEADMDELLELRNKDSADFKRQLKDDADSVKLLEEAIIALSKFYKKNKIPLALAQASQEPEYTVDKDKAPDTTWSGDDYGGRKSENEGIISILSMLKEDLEKEMKTGREEDAASQAAYEKDRQALKDTLDAQAASKAAAEKELQDLEASIGDTERAKDADHADLAAEEEMKAAIGTDCAWVKTHFDSRREKRKTELDGLLEAKNYLAGVESGSEIE